MLNFGIIQNPQANFTEVLGDLPVYDLDLYEEMGDNAHKVGNENEAISWYSKGLAMARELRSPEKIKLFTNLIITSL
jgi:hypothetical protein